MDKVIKKFKELGASVTPQRMAVVEFLKNNHKHPTADEIYTAIRKKYPSISPATVYSSLELLKRAGEIQELSIRKDKACFDPITEPHHHLMCTKCGKIWDVHLECPSDCPLIKKGTVKGHKVHEVRAYIYGTCAACARKSKDKA